MKKIATLLIATCFTFACRHPAAQQTDAEIREGLKKAMTTELYKKVNGDSSIVQYHVLDVYFFNAPGDYDCEFKVHMHERHLDTTGIMKARITKDFLKVKRYY